MASKLIWHAWRFDRGNYETVGLSAFQIQYKKAQFESNADHENIRQNRKGRQADVRLELEFTARWLVPEVQGTVQIAREPEEKSFHKVTRLSNLDLQENTAA